MKPIALDEFFRFRFLSQPCFSPSGNHAAFVLTEIDRKKDAYRSYLYTIKDGMISRLTSAGEERSFLFLDENTILFPADREKEENEKDPLTSRYYSISLHGGEAVPALTFPIPVTKLLPLTGGDYLVLGRTFPGWEDLYKGDRKQREAFLRDRKENADYEEIGQVPWWWNGSTYTKGAYTSLFRYSGKKKTLSRLTSLNESVSDAVLAPDKRTVYFLREPVKALLPLGGCAELCRLDLQTGAITSLVESREDLDIAGIAAGEHFLLVLASDRRYGLNTDTDFWKLPYEGEKLVFYARHGESVGSSVGSDIRYGGGHAVRMSGDVCIFISTRFDSAHLFRLEDGMISRISDVPGSTDCFDVCRDRILCVALRDMRGQELYDEKGRRLSHFNSAVLRGRYVAKPEILNISRNDHEIHGFVLPPMDYDPAKKYPVILDIHGGPKTVYGPVFYHEMQYWAGKGYFVIFCNPTGSDGRGPFMDIRGRYGEEDYADLMAFCDAALEAWPAMDAENFFETGGSYGGFMTNWIIGHTNRFRACASQRSISNWFSFYGVSDIGVAFAADQCAADPWTDPEKLWQQSPLRYADQARTPTLFIHSFEDYRCPVDQGYQMFTALIAHGVESRMVCFRGENHELSRSGKPSHRLKRLKAITDWFDTHRG